MHTFIHWNIYAQIWTEDIPRPGEKFEFEDGTFTLNKDSVVISDPSMFYKCDFNYDTMTGELIKSQSTVEMRILFKDKDIYNEIEEGVVIVFSSFNVFNNTPIECIFANLQIDTILTNRRVNNKYWQIIFNVDIPGLFDVRYVLFLFRFCFIFVLFVCVCACVCLCVFCAFFLTHVCVRCMHVKMSVYLQKKSKTSHN